MRIPTDLEEPTVFGDIAFCDIVAEELGLGLLETPDDWLPNLPRKYTRRTIDLIQHRELVNVDTRKFIKPANDKVFYAGIFEHGRHVPYRQINPNAPVLVSDVVDFEVEVRCHILDRSVVSASIYQGMHWASSPEQENKILEQAEAWMDLFLGDPGIDLPSAIVVDVGKIADVGWAVVEANQAYASGIYAGGYNTKEGRGADPEQVLRVVQRSAQTRDTISESDLLWLRPMLRDLS